MHGGLALIVPPANETGGISSTPDVLPVWLDEFNGEDLNHILYDQNNENRYLRGAVLGVSDELVRVLDEAWPQLQGKLLGPVVKQLSAVTLKSTDRRV